MRDPDVSCKAGALYPGCLSGSCGKLKAAPCPYAGGFMCRGPVVRTWREARSGPLEEEIAMVRAVWPSEGLLCQEQAPSLGMSRPSQG